MACDPKKPKLRENLDPGRYRKVSTRLWNDFRFRALSAPQPCGQHLVLFLLTNPATGSIPGLYRARESALAEELGWTLEGFREAFGEAFRQGFVKADWKAGLVWLPNAVKHDPPASPNVVVGWGRVVRNALPECPLLLEALRGISACLDSLFESPNTFKEAFQKAFPEAFLKGLGEAFQEGLGEPRVQIPETRYQSPEEKLPRAGAREPTPVDGQDLLPHEPPPSTEPALGELLDADFQVLRGAEYRRDRGDPAAMRELLARGTPAEIRRRWRIGIAVVGYGRCSKWGDLVRFWNDHAAAPPERGGAPPAKPAARPLNPADYREGPVEDL